MRYPFGGLSLLPVVILRNADMTAPFARARFSARPYGSYARLTAMTLPSPSAAT